MIVTVNGDRIFINFRTERVSDHIDENNFKDKIQKAGLQGDFLILDRFSSKKGEGWSVEDCL